MKNQFYQKFITPIINIVKTITGQNKRCQSCAMPLNNKKELYGTESDGTKNTYYCIYCYENGQFTINCTMEEMINMCVPHVKSNGIKMTEEQFRKFMLKCLPNMKRWRKK